MHDVTSSRTSGQMADPTTVLQGGSEATMLGVLDAEDPQARLVAGELAGDLRGLIRGAVVDQHTLPIPQRLALQAPEACDKRGASIARRQQDRDLYHQTCSIICAGRANSAP